MRIRLYFTGSGLEKYIVSIISQQWPTRQTVVKMVLSLNPSSWSLNLPQIQTPFPFSANPKGFF